MDIPSVPDPNAINIQPSKSDSGTRLAEDFDTFLSLLTTQLANQDPLDPLDSNEFVAQLVSFSGVEQAINTNTKLDSLVGLLTTSQTAAAVGFLGTTVEAKGDTATLANGEATYIYNLPANAASTTIQIRDDQGNIVFTGSGEVAAGDHTYVWDGRDSNGTALPDGVYSISVTAKDSFGKPIDATTRISGRVTGVDTSSGSPVLTINGAQVPFEDIVSVRETDPGTAL